MCVIIASEQGFALAFSLLLCCWVFSPLLLELASAFMTQIPSDKLKMIDSESKMETAPRGASDCPRLCPHTSARLREHACAQTLHGDVECKFSAPRASCVSGVAGVSRCVCVCVQYAWTFVCSLRTEGWAYYIGFLTLLKNVRRWQISDVRTSKPSVCM